jgi:hypothetical protein
MSTHTWTTPFGMSFRENPPTQKYLQVTSHHPLAHKRSIITTLTDRAKMICYKPNQGNELQHVKALSKTMATPYRISTDHQRPEPPAKTRDNHTAYVPYIHSTNDGISKLLNPETINKMAFHFRFSQNRQPPTQKSRVYHISCSCGKIYIDQMGCHISTRILEHIRDTRMENQQSVSAEHSAETKHNTDFNRTEVTANIWTHHPHNIREAIEITKYPHNSPPSTTSIQQSLDSLPVHVRKRRRKEREKSTHHIVSQT